MTSSSELADTIRQLMAVITTRSMQERANFVKAAGLSMAQFGILMHLNYQHGCGISHLGEHMDISAAAASQLVDRLVQHGLVERAEDPNDRRAKVLTLTSKGQDLIERSLAIRTRWVDELVSAIRPEDYAEVDSTLSKVTQAVKDTEQQEIK